MDKIEQKYQLSFRRSVATEKFVDCCQNIYLAVLSASELTDGGGIYSYNFSTGIGKALGGSLG